jgi:hypothetical protein
MVERGNAVMNARAARVDTKLDGLIESVDQRFHELEDRLGRRIDTQVEHMRDDIRLLAEAMGAGFDRIDRRFDEVIGAWNLKFGDRDAVLVQHDRRITALEQGGGSGR